MKILNTNFSTVEEFNTFVQLCRKKDVKMPELFEARYGKANAIDEFHCVDVAFREDGYVTVHQGRTSSSGRKHIPYYKMLKKILKSNNKKVEKEQYKIIKAIKDFIHN